MVAIDVIEKVHYTSQGWDWGWAKFSYSAKTEAKVSNYKKSWWKYRSYATTCEMRNILVTTNFGSSSISHLRSSREVNSLTMIWNVMSQSSYNFALYGADAVETEIFEAYGQASNRGVGERWVTVSQQ